MQHAWAGQKSGNLSHRGIFFPCVSWIHYSPSLISTRLTEASSLALTIWFISFLQNWLSGTETQLQIWRKTFLGAKNQSFNGLSSYGEYHPRLSEEYYGWKRDIFCQLWGFVSANHGVVHRKSDGSGWNEIQFIPTRPKNLIQFLLVLSMLYVSKSALLSAVALI